MSLVSASKVQALLFTLSLGLLSGLLMKAFSAEELSSSRETEPDGCHDLSQETSFCTVNEVVSSVLPVPRGGMAHGQVFLRQAALNIFDNVLGYAPPIGPSVNSRLNYSYLEALSSVKSDFANFGTGWTLNWVAFLRLDSKGNATVMVPGGGSEYYAISTGKGDALYKHNLMSQALLIARPEGEFERQLPDGSVEVYGLGDEKGRIFLTEMRSPSGNSVKIGYDKSCRTETITDAIGQISKIRYLNNTPGSVGFFKISEIEDPFGRKAKFTYDKDGERLKSSTDAVGLTSTFDYAPNSNSVTELRTVYGVTKFTHYKPAGSPNGSLGIRINYANGSSTVTEHWAGERHATYEWAPLALELYPNDPAKGVYSHCTITKWLTRPNGSEISVKASVKEPLSGELVYSYSGQSLKGFVGESNLPVSVSRRLPVRAADGSMGTGVQTSSYSYNSFGHVLKHVDPVGRTRSYKYAPNEIDLLEIRQTKGNNNELLARFEYDDRHHATLSIDAAGKQVRYEYNKLGELIKTVDPNNNAWSLNYDAKGFLRTLQGPMGNDNVLGKFDYDAAGRVRTRIDVDGHAITFDYDNADRLIKKTFEDGTSELIKYDKLDAVYFQDRAGRITKRTYDNLDRMISISDPLGRKSQYEWCKCGALRKMTDPAGSATEWHHDIEGRTIQKKFADGTEIRFEYEKDGPRLLRRTDALQQKTDFVYNLDNTIAEINYEAAKNSTPNVKFVYDPNYPRIKSASSSSGTISFEHNSVDPKQGAGLLRSISNSAIPNSTISFEYDSTGNVIRRGINGDANIVRHKYDAMGRPVSESNALGEFKFEYADSANKGTDRIASVIYPNGIVSKFRYDGSSGEERLRSITNGALSEFDYAYDKAGQIVKLQESFNGKAANDFVFSYDAAGQFTDSVNQLSKVPAAGNIHYEYNSASNRISVKSGSSLREIAYNSMNELISLAEQSSTDEKNSGPKQTKSFAYDANGNLLSDGERNYKWDAENRLIRIDYGVTGKATEFAYDACGQRYKITEFSGAVADSVRYLLWCGGKVAEERDGHGDVKKKLFEFGENVGGKNTFFGRDHLGSTRQIMDDSGAILARIDYDPFGQVIAPGDSGGLPSAQYAGYYTHSASGLNLTLFRAYDSKLGRWISRDPVGEFGLQGTPEWHVSSASREILASNLYNYVGNSTFGFTDPLGLQERSQYVPSSTYVPGQYTTGATSAGQANGAYNYNTGGNGFANSSYANQVQSVGAGGGGTVMGVNTVGTGTGALPESGYRQGDGQQSSQSGLLSSNNPNRDFQMQMIKYQADKQAWDNMPFWEKFGKEEPKPPTQKQSWCLRK